MTKKRIEKLKQQKIEEWKEQGFNDTQIKQKLQKYEQKLNKKRIIKAVSISIGTVVVLTSLSVVVQKVIDHFSKLLNEEDKKHIKKRKDEEERLIDDISNDVPDKDPNDIVIPKVPTKEEGATDEEIAEAEKKVEEAKQEKEYWTSVKETKEKITENISNQIFEITKDDPDYDKSQLPDYLKGFQKVRRINNAYVMNDGSLLVDCDYLYLETFKDGTTALRQMNATFRFVNENLPSTFNTTQDITNFMTNESTSSEMFGMNEGVVLEELNDVFKNHICNIGTLGEYVENGAKIELEKISAYEYDGDCPIRYYSIAKVTDGEKIIYVASDVASDVKTGDFTMDEWRTWAKDPNDKGGVFCDYEYIFLPLNLDWKALSEEYSGQKTQEAEAQSEIEEISTRDENGNVTGFDWNAYADLMKQKEAEKEAKELEQTVTQQESVTYSDQELSL